jgi:hypothetical protein
MKNILLLTLGFVAYIWVIGSGREALFLEKGKQVASEVKQWLADTDFKKTPLLHEAKKRSRRWN